MKIFKPFALIILGMLIMNSCQKGNLVDNPNISVTGSFIPLSLILNHLTSNLVRSDEKPWGGAYNYGQYWLSNYAYYRGPNSYNWTTSEDTYDVLEYAIQLQNQVKTQFPINYKLSAYYGLSLFFEAYAGIWTSQRIGDIPYSFAGNANNLTPKFDAQHDVYKLALARLDSANTVFNNANASPNGNLSSAGDVLFSGVGASAILGGKWQKVINSYTLRVLISLSKRSVDNADLNIPGKFSNILSNPTTYPILGSNSDNLTYLFNTINPYPIKARGNQPYNNYANMNQTFISILSSNQDPRIFLFATPAPAQLSAGKAYSDFTAFVGADISQAQTAIIANNYSYANGARYYNTIDGTTADPFIIIGYPEMCLNIAEGINRGWVTGLSSSTFYKNGVNASLSSLGLTDGESLSVSDLGGKSLGNVNISFPNFKNNPNVLYAGDNATGLSQILIQKYIAYFNNSGYEGFYQWRRTGIPNFTQGNPGVGTSTGNIPLRWQISSLDQTYNSTNYTSSITAQFGGTDDITKPTWLTK